MPNLLTMLREADEGLHTALAQVWGVTLANKKPEEQIRLLNEAMQDKQKAEAVWVKLSEDERQALQALLGSKLKMQAAMFTRLYGDIRKMGKGQIERENPHKSPKSIAEGLFYRGLISEISESGKQGIKQFVYIPEDLAPVLPSHKTAYEGIEKMPLPAQPQIRQLEPYDDEYLDDMQQADTSIVDDMATVLAYLRNWSAAVLEDAFLPADAEKILPFLLKPSIERLNFLLGIGVSADLIMAQEGRAYPKKNNLQKWLEKTRSEQLKMLLEAWHKGIVYRDLWHVSGLFPDPDAGFPYDTVIGRDALHLFLKRLAPPNDWFGIEEFCQAIKIIDPDFQRPAGDYESWYIRDSRGEYLRGFDSWDAVEGALLEFYLKSPLHWLGLMDTSEDAVRLNAYGRAWLGMNDWPSPTEANDLVTVQDDGVLSVSRKVSRIDRFQVARFSTWGKPEDNLFYYRLDSEGLELAEAQGITTGHILAFLKRQVGEKPLPRRVNDLLENWQGSATMTEVSFERLLVLRTTAPEVLDRIYNEPNLRRYLGARLGPMACVVRAGQETDLQVALGDAGIKVEMIG
jgi:hypothetical protein